jgi:hypothetical protein
VTVDVGADICGDQNGDSGSDDVKSADATRAPLSRLLAAAPGRLGGSARPARSAAGPARLVVARAAWRAVPVDRAGVRHDGL